MAWRSSLSDALLALDEQQALAHIPAASADLALAFALWGAAGDRIDELIAACGTGRMSDEEVEAAHELVWSPVVADDGSPLGADLPEVGFLLDALVTRLEQAAGARGHQLTTITGLLAPLTERVATAQASAHALGEMVNQVDAIADRLGRLGPQHDPDHVAAEVAAIDEALSPIERDLGELARSKGSVSGDVDDLARRCSAAVVLEQSTRELAERCRAKVGDPPHLAVPSVAALGAVPTQDEIGSLDWRAGRSRLDAFATKLSRVERALATANAAYAAPLQRRDDLRGLLGGYRAMAADRGLGEQPNAAKAYDAAKEALWSSPCDLDTAAQLVAEYQREVRLETGDRR